ncbi:hypothetical protein [Paraburkholderia flagellata]|uniref:hypothetical protein n=1 Tax=Paraburkholderia flagellata TaxID=2883241 RepID=UPI001F413981|nr:hypothetical protein [Paraburkholderia flagellata]
MSKASVEENLFRKAGTADQTDQAPSRQVKRPSNLERSRPANEATLVREGLFAAVGMHQILDAFRRENIGTRGNSIIPFGQPCFSPELVRDDRHKPVKSNG